MSEDLVTNLIVLAEARCRRTPTSAGWRSQGDRKPLLVVYYEVSSTITILEITKD